MIIIVMGVSGAGKTTVGRQLADALSVDFYDADDFHLPAAIAKMQDGQPLSDADRQPWLERLAALLQAVDVGGRSAVLACSALKQHYRSTLRSAAAEERVVFVYLTIAPKVAAERLRARAGHFMPESLVESQFAALEPPTDAMVVDATLSPHVLVGAIRERLGQGRTVRPAQRPGASC